MISEVWGGLKFNVTQEFGVNLPGIPDWWYSYATGLGLDYGDHPGLDVGMPLGTPIFAAEGGIVEQAGFSDSYRPEPVFVATPDDPTTNADDRERHIYGHLRRAVVRAGQMVEAGDLLGYSGEQTIHGTYTPDGSGPHLHMEVVDIADSLALDPTFLLTGADTPGKNRTGTPKSIGDGGFSRAWANALETITEGLQRAGLGLAGVALLILGALVAFPEVRAAAGKASSLIPMARIAKGAKTARTVGAAA